MRPGTAILPRPRVEAEHGPGTSRSGHTVTMDYPEGIDKKPGSLKYQGVPPKRYPL